MAEVLAHQRLDTLTQVGAGAAERLGEDVYIVLTGFDLERRMANFRVYVNPLINWVWLSSQFCATLACSL